jgi:ketosteroid isomerase-like protein
MSQENVEAFKRATAAVNRRDVEGFLDGLDPEVVWPRPAILVSLGGEATVYRGHEGIREVLRDVYDALAELHVEYPEIRDLGDRLVAIGRLRARGTESGATTESAVVTVTDFRNGKAVRIRTYLDPKEALEAAGLEEQAMSQENVELVREATDAGNRRDIDAFVAFLSPDVVWEENPELPGL